MPAPVSHRLCLLFVLLLWRFQKGEALLSFHGIQQPLAANPQKTNWQTQETKKSVGLQQSPPHRAHRDSGHYHVTIAEDPPVPTGSVATKKKKFPSRISPTSRKRASLLAAAGVGTLAVLLAMSHPQLASAVGATDVGDATKIPEFPSWKTVAQYAVVQVTPSLVPVALLIFFVNKSISDAANNTNLKIEGVKTELNQVKTELNGKIEGVDGKIEGVKTELKADIEKVNGKIEGMKTELMAEIRLLNGKIDGKLDNQDKAIDTQNKAIAAFEKDVGAHLSEMNNTHAQLEFETKKKLSELTQDEEIGGQEK